VPSAPEPLTTRIPAASSTLSPVERVLRLVTDVRAGEGRAAILMFANVFLVLCAYYFMKSLRDGWLAVSEVQWLTKMEVKAYSSFAQTLLLIAVVSAYARLAGRWPRAVLVTRSTLACMVVVLGFWLLQPGVIFGHVPAAGIAFYLWVGMFGVFVVSQFWAFAADFYTDERGRRVMPLIVVGATAGAAFGSYVTEKITKSEILGHGTLLLLSLLPLAGSIWLTNAAEARGPTGEGPAPEHAHPPAENPGGAIPLILRSRFLLGVAVMTLLTTWVNTNGENLLFNAVQGAVDREVAAAGLTGAEASNFVRRETTAFYGNLFFWVNFVALFLQTFAASRLLRWGGVGFIILLLPFVSFVSYAAMAIFPVLGMIKSMKIVENSTAYSINNTARHVLWLPTSPEAKFKAKPAVETLFWRAGDGFAAATVMVGVHLFALTTEGFLGVNVALVGLWLAAAWVVVREHRGFSRPAA
jgi:AAA family ATP:ADP antiporter